MKFYTKQHSYNGIDFVLGHTLYMKAIHGGKAKNDKIDSEKIARLLVKRRHVPHRLRLSATVARCARSHAPSYAADAAASGIDCTYPQYFEPIQPAAL